MEQKVYVASGRFILEAGKPPVVEYVYSSFCLEYFGIIRVLFSHVPPSYETLKGSFRSHPWRAFSLSSSNVSTFSLEHDTSNTDFKFTQGTR